MKFGQEDPKGMSVIALKTDEKIVNYLVYVGGIDGLCLQDWHAYIITLPQKMGGKTKKTMCYST